MYLIAEIGVNYYDIAKQRNLSLLSAAKLMIWEARWAGANCVKFQTYKADKIAAKNSPAFWDTNKTQREVYAQYDSFNRAEYKQLSDYCKEIGIDFLSTPFDLESVDMLDEFSSAFKISSSDITNHPLIAHIASKGKRIYLSTGASYIQEISDALTVIAQQGKRIKPVIMHCILSYPTEYKDANLGMIEILKKIYPTFEIGYSDHTIADRGMVCLTQACSKGATVIEKHFTLDKTLLDNDHSHSFDPNDILTFKSNVEILPNLNGYKRVIPSERLARQYARRSIIAKKDIKEDEVITKDMVDFKRPGTGISPSEAIKWL